MYLIEQNSIDFYCNSQPLGKKIHAQFGALMQNEFYPKLERLFEQYDQPNYVWNIDQLHINIPDLTSENWKNNFIDLALFQIEEYLKNNKPIVAFSSYENNQNSVFLSKQQQAVELFFYYLKTGILPQNTLAKQTDLVWKNIEITTEFITELLAFFNANPERLLRLVFGVSNSFRTQILQQISNQPTALVRVLENVLQLEKPLTIAQKSALQIIIKNQEKKLQWIDFVIFTIVVFELSTSKAKLVEVFIKNSVHWDLSYKELALVFSAIEAQLQSKKGQLPQEQRLFVTEIKSQLESKIASLKTEESLAMENTNKEQIISDFHFISNAGLVLLHPFLQRLFEQLNLCQREVWKNKESQHKAILLSQYLVTGKTDFFENELLLNKIFCGLQFDEEVNLGLEITNEDKEVCDSLLLAVLQHWKPMNHSSVTALQETFLLRDGKLSFSNSNSIELIVESKGVDILLGQLPWGIGHIKTLWMEEYLICEWS